MTSTPAPSPDDYAVLLETVQLRVRQAQAAERRVVTAARVGVYWSLGQQILLCQDRQGRGCTPAGRCVFSAAVWNPDRLGVDRCWSG